MALMIYLGQVLAPRMTSRQTISSKFSSQVLSQKSVAVSDDADSETRRSELSETSAIIVDRIFKLLTGHQTAKIAQSETIEMESGLPHQSGDLLNEAVSFDEMQELLLQSLFSQSSSRKK
jgi:hypothetical protein